MKSWIKSFMIMLVSLFLVLGCQDVADELVGKKPEGARTINITMIAKSSDNPVFLSAKIGAETAAKDLSEKYSMLDVNILWSTPLTESAEEQAEIIRNTVIVICLFIVLVLPLTVLLKFEGDLQPPPYQNRYRLKFCFIINLGVTAL